jgi:hypothetical protein
MKHREKATTDTPVLVFLPPLFPFGLFPSSWGLPQIFQGPIIPHTRTYPNSFKTAYSMGPSGSWQIRGCRNQTGRKYDHYVSTQTGEHIAVPRRSTSTVMQSSPGINLFFTRRQSFSPRGYETGRFRKRSDPATGQPASRRGYRVQCSSVPV